MFKKVFLFMIVSFLFYSCAAHSTSDLAIVRKVLKVRQGATPKINAQASYDIVDYSIGRPTFDLKSIGDYWGPAWAKDGNLYAGANDATGFDDGCQAYMNVVSVRIDGDPVQGFHGSTLGCLEEYSTPDNAAADTANVNWETWDNGNMISVDGTLYWTAEIMSGERPPYASLLKSKDGATWCAQGPGCAHAQHHSGTFENLYPMFVDYGRDPGLQGDPEWPDQADRYVYATAYAFGTDDLFLCRVSRSKIERLNARDWECVIDYKVAQKTRTPVWGPMTRPKKAVFGASLGDSVQGKLNAWGKATWVAPLRKYIMIQHYAAPCKGEGDPSPNCTFDFYWYDPTTSHWFILAADHIWGPWTQVGREYISSPEGLNSPAISSKFVSQDLVCDGKDCHLKVWVFVSGDHARHPELYYHLGWVPMTLKAHASSTAGKPVMRLF